MRYFIALLLAIACCTPAYAQEDTALAAQLRAIAKTHQGKLALYAHDLKTGKTVSLNGDTAVPTASVIKLTVLYDALKQAEEGKLKLSDPLTLTKANQVEGSGMLQFMDTPMQLTVKDTMNFMVDLSDNTATNMLIDKLGLQNIDARIQSIGLQNTWLYKKVFMAATGPVPADQPQFGLGKTTPREMASVIERFETCNLNPAGAPSTAPTDQDRQLCALAITILKQQTDSLDIQRYMQYPVANKTGALDQVRNDVGIVYAKNGPIVISAFTYDNKDQSWGPDNTAQITIGKLARAIVDRWQ